MKLDNLKIVVLCAIVVTGAFCFIAMTFFVADSIATAWFGKYSMAGFPIAMGIFLFVALVFAALADLSKPSKKK
jgi:hypothetical protein